MLVIFLTLRKVYMKGGSRSGNPMSSPDPIRVDTPDRPMSFGYKCMWIAVKGNDIAEIIKVFRIDNIQPSNWTHGIQRAYDGGIFISPQIDGWTFIIGWGLPNGDTEKSIREVEERLNELSSLSGEAQFFGTHRGVGFAAWIRSVEGEIQRTYSNVSSEKLAIKGEPTEIERTLDLDFPDEDEVMAVAGSWSINPQTLDDRDDLPLSLGFINYH